jgi:hypothetical protein
MKNRYLLLTGTLALITPVLLQPIRLAGLQAPAPTVTVSGTVTRTGTSEPIPDVQVSLSTGAGGGFQGQSLQQLQQTVDRARAAGIAVPPAIEAQLATLQRGGANTPIQLNATTDRAGRFVFQNVPTGQYIVRAEREGYFGALINPLAAGNPPTLVQTNVTIAAGEPPANLSFSLTPGSAISGTAMDSEGRPVVGAQVLLYRLNYLNGGPVLQGVTGNNTTDDRGAYRVFRIPPGDYYVEVTPNARGLAGGFAARGAAPAKQGSVRTFYPDALTAKDARMVSLHGGEDMTGVAVAVRTSPLVTVSGQVLSSVPLPPAQVGPRGRSVTPSVALLLVPHDKNALEVANARQVGNANLDSSSNGQFQITGVIPGSYDLYARLNNPEGGRGGFDLPIPNSTPTGPIYYWGRTSFEAGFNDVQGISLTIGPGLELKAFPTIDGSTTNVAGNVRLNLLSVDSARFMPAYVQQNAALPAGADGSITLPFVNEGVFRLVSTVNPGVAARGAAGPQLRDLYVEDIREGGVSVYDNGLTVGKQSPRPIEIIIKTNGGVVEGDVFDTQQQLKSGAVVVLVPAQTRRQNPALYKTTTSNAMAHFTLRGVPPGQYKLFAWESVPNGAYQDPTFIAKFEERGRSITVNASNTTTAQVTLINEK